MKKIDQLLDNTTMYRLVLYYLILLFSIALLFSAIGILPLNPFLLLISFGIILLSCLLTNILFSITFASPAATDSVFITAFILTLILPPATSFPSITILIWAGILAISSKYILAINRSHIFNPAAISVTLIYLFLGTSATWWIGSAVMLPFVATGLLIIRKIKRFLLIGVFLTVTLLTTVFIQLLNREAIFPVFTALFYSSPLCFFAFVMLVEPLTSPVTKRMQVIYAAITGVLFTPQIHFGSVFILPEMALCIGNVFSFIAEKKTKIHATILEKTQLSPDVIQFRLQPDKPVSFEAGQYMEWTLKHHRADSRGNRRFFSIASSPTEEQLLLGIKFYPVKSSFKSALYNARTDTLLYGQQVSGTFILPDDTSQKLLFIAGGIGITPFRSMLTFLCDTKQKRDISLLYIIRSTTDNVYVDTLERARVEIGLHYFLSLTDTGSVPPGWPGGVGRLTIEQLLTTIPDINDRLCFISGPPAMVKDSASMLSKLHIPKNHIKTDYFTGYA